MLPEVQVVAHIDQRELTSFRNKGAIVDTVNEDAPMHFAVTFDNAPALIRLAAEYGRISKIGQ